MKHAFLIIAHGNWELLRRLIRKLDHQNNDIYLHIDKKISFSSNVKDLLIHNVSSSNLFFTERIRISWGGYSVVKCELLMLKSAFQENKYRYFHIMSGVDFPIKSMDIIHQYFIQNDGKEFVDLELNEWTKQTIDQIRYYHPLHELIGRCGSRKNLFYLLEYYLLKIQSLFRIDRRKKYPNMRFYKASNWCSITDDFVKYILSKEKWIQKSFGMTKCSDEIFIPTLLFNSIFASRQNTSMRLIDWSRGTPYIFTIDELEEIKNSENLFIRKVGLSNEKQSALVDYLETL